MKKTDDIEKLGKALSKAVRLAIRRPGMRVPVMLADGTCSGYITSPKALPPQDCCTETRRAVNAETAELACKIGEDMIQNGKELSKFPGERGEGRLRELAGMLFLDVAQILWMDDRHHDDMRKIKDLENIIRKKIGDEEFDKALADYEREEGSR